MQVRLDEYRRQRLQTVDEFVKDIGITHRTYYNIMRGRPLRVTTIRTVADRLGVPASEVDEFRAMLPERGKAESTGMA